MVPEQPAESGGGMTHGSSGSVRIARRGAQRAAVAPCTQEEREAGLARALGTGLPQETEAGICRGSSITREAWPAEALGARRHNGRMEGTLAVSKHQAGSVGGGPAAARGTGAGRRNAASGHVPSEQEAEERICPGRGGAAMARGGGAGWRLAFQCRVHVCERGAPSRER